MHRPPGPTRVEGLPGDSVDALLVSWADSRRDLDFAPVAVMARLARVRSYVDIELESVYKTHGLGGPSFGMLVTLARLGDRQGVSQKWLMDELCLTSGTVSVRVDRLAEDGLVERRQDPASKRTSLITLTDAGRQLFERVAPAHLANEARLLSALDAGEREQLATLLRKLLIEFEGSTPSVPARLGLTIAPAHRALALREAVGLSPVAGLLVQTVEVGSPAAAAGVRTGDLLVRAGGLELRGIEALHAAITDADDGRGLGIDVLRGTRNRRLTISLKPQEAGNGGHSAPSARPRRGEHLV